MKYILTLGVIAVLISSCAKVYDEPAPCTGAKPITPVVQDVALQSGGSTYVSAQAESDVSLIWSGPKDFSYKGSQMYLDFSNGTNYGAYTVKAVRGGCVSDLATFNVSSTLNIPCNVNNATYLALSTGVTEQFYNNPSFYNQYFNQRYISTYSNYSSNSTLLNMYFNTSGSPQGGTVLTLDSTGVFGSGNCYVELGPSSQSNHSVSGKVYVRGHTEMIFCSAKFKTHQGTYFTITGGVSSY